MKMRVIETFHSLQGQAVAPAIRMPEETQVYRFGFKRLFDICLTLMVAPVALPIILIFAFLVALDGGNPFYCQKRIGRHGRIYRMWKLRSMVVDAQALLVEHLAAHPAAREEWDRCQKLTDDPRITRVGRLIRKTSIDELPQLWNVLNGTMSVIGPRPIMVEQQELYTGRCYYKLRPGLTGPWQVSDRHTSTFVERVRYDDDYCRHLSFATDLLILYRTVGVVFRCTGV